MLDNGFPLATEANILKELIKPPNMLRDVVNSGWLQIIIKIQEVNILVLVSAVAAVAHAVIDPRAGDHLGGGGGAVEQLPGARGGARLVRTVLG